MRHAVAPFFVPAAAGTQVHNAEISRLVPPLSQQGVRKYDERPGKLSPGNILVW
jgi:hypothetical protein